ncbi:MAG: Hsp70 family protein [Sandaracinus sp.]
MRLGIDLGTTRTVVAAVQGGSYPLASFEAEGAVREWIPGVAAQIDGAIAFGWEAVARASEAQGVVRSIKRAVADVAPDDPISALPSRPTALALMTGFVEHVASAVRASSLDVPAGEPFSAAIAVPANATSRQRWLTIEACRRAGIDVLSVVNEPTAAGIEYAHRHLGALNKRSPKRYVVVYDLGGGTFDTSAISLRGRHFDLLATEGIGRLGGDDFDDALLALALARGGIDASSLTSVDRARLADAARAAKEAMTTSSRNVMLDVGTVIPDAAPIVLPATEVLAACEPLVERTIATVDRLFASLPAHGIDPEDARQLGAVYVVGGGASFAGVIKALRARLGRKVLLAPIPYAATAIGLAVAADPDAGVLVHENVTRHFGVWREAAGGREKIFDPIFDKDAALAASESESEGERRPERVVRRRYRPRHNVGHLRFLECSSLDAQGVPNGELTPWREVCFPYDPALRDRTDLDRAVAPSPALAHEEIEETYRYTDAGAITVTIANLTRGYARVYDLGRME